MNILLIEDEKEIREAVRSLILSGGKAEITELTLLQAAIDLIASGRTSPDLIICGYRGGNQTLLKSFLSASSKVPCIFLTEAATALPDLFLVPREAMLETLERREVPLALSQSLERLRQDGLFKWPGDTPDSAFFGVDTANLVLRQPLRADIFLRLAPHRYCRRFQVGDCFDAADLENHFKKKGVSKFYLRKEQAQVLFDAQGDTVDTLIRQTDPDQKEMRKAAIVSLEIIHDVVDQLGFTPQVQELASKTVALTLKALGNSPKLSSILEKLRRHEGRYITSHSIMLAEIACAIAHRIGWSSAPVFLKLSLAAFLHDLNLKDDYLASFKTLKQAKEAGDFREEALQLFEIHPVKAADYARKFQGIPPEVDTILLQHHERPDGSGFPLGLQHQAIAPIACAFIVAHDLLHFFLEQIPTNSREAMIQAFLAENSTRYAQGTFREIRDALASGSAVTP